MITPPHRGDCDQQSQGFPPAFADTFVCLNRTGGSYNDAERALCVVEKGFLACVFLSSD